MFKAITLAAGVSLLLSAGAVSLFAQTAGKSYDDAAESYAKKLLKDGQEIFRHDTFGSEEFWGGKLKLHQAIAGEKLGGVGAGISPQKALELGLKVDVNAVPKEVAEGINSGKVDLTDPASTLALLKADAVVGVKGFFSDDGKTLTSVGIQCSLCHSTVDDAFSPGIGHRLDGWPNRDLNVGAIVAAAPDLSAFTEMLQISEAEVKKAVEAWGPGKFDAELNLDGKAFRPDGKTSATLNPSAFGLAGVNNHTWTGAWGNVTYWNAYVSNLEMHGQGVFFDPRLDDAEKYPVAARTKQGHKQKQGKDLITAKLPALHFYQLSLPKPEPPEGSFDKAAAEKGEALFNERPGARLATYRLSSPSQVGICTPPRKSASMISRPCGLPTAAIAPNRSGHCGIPKRSTRADSITMAVLRLWRTSWLTMTSTSTSNFRTRKRTPLLSISNPSDFGSSIRLNWLG